MCREAETSPPKPGHGRERKGEYVPERVEREGGWVKRNLDERRDKTKGREEDQVKA